MGGGGEPISRRLSNKGCQLCHEATANVIHEMTGGATSGRRHRHRCTAIFCAQAVIVAFQKDGNEGLYFAARTVGSTAKLFCSKRQLE